MINLWLECSFLTLVQVTPRVRVTPFYAIVLWNGVSLIDFGGFLKVLKICYITQVPATKCKTICLLALSFKPFPLVMIYFFEDNLSSRPISKVTLPNGVTLITLRVTLITFGVTLIGWSKLSQEVWIKLNIYNYCK